MVDRPFSSPMIEKSCRIDPDVPEDVLSCQAVADFLLASTTRVLDTLEFSTPRDDLLGPGQTVHLRQPPPGPHRPRRATTGCSTSRSPWTSGAPSPSACAA